MSLENAILSLAAAIEKLAAGSAAAPAAAPASTPAAEKAEKPAAKAAAKKEVPAYAPKYTFEQMQALMNDVKEKIGKDKAIGIRDAHGGGAAKLSEITDPKVVDAVAAAAEAALAEADEGV